MTLGIKLKTLRLHKNYTQQYVAEKLSISPQTISKWENDWTYPSLKNLLLLSNLYQISLDELLKYTPTLPTSSLRYNSYLCFTPEMIILFLIFCISLILPVFSVFTLFGLLYYLKKINVSHHLFIINKIFCFYNVLYFCIFLVKLYLQCRCF